MRRLKVFLATAVAAAALPGAAAAIGTPSEALKPPKLDTHLSRRLATAQPGDTLRVFVTGATLADATSAARASGLRVDTTWPRVRTAVAVGPAAAVARVRQAPGVIYVEGDRPISLNLDTSHAATRGEQALQGFTAPDGGESTGVDGTGVSIAVIDSGIDGTHPFFELPDGSSRVVRNLKLACHQVADPCTGPAGDAPDPAWVDMTSVNDTDHGALGGHGTHVAGIAGGGYGVTADGRKLHGAAPDARLVGLGVGEGLSIYGGYAAMNWVLEHNAAPCGAGVPVDRCPPIKVVNNSWGPTGGGEYDPASVGSALQDALVQAGVTVVWAAGNGDATNNGGDGSDNRVNPPAQSPTPGVLGVANYDDGDTGTRDGGLDSSSSRGEQGRADTYPDISAPGASITSSCRPTLPICYGNADTGDGSRLYYSIGGTSMAAPHIAGIVAQLLEADPSLTPGEIEDVLEDTAYKFSGGGPYEADPRNPDDLASFDKGHGLVDVVEAVARVRSLQAPAAPGSCLDPTAPVVQDAGGDATAAIVPTPLPSEPGLDVREAGLAWDGAALTFRIKVTDLTATPPTGSTGEYFDFNFSYGGTGYYLGAVRSRVDGEQYVLGRFAPTRTTLAELTGSFDDATDEITIVLPAQTFADAVPDAPAIAPGSVLSGFGVTSRRETGVIVPNADDAGGACPYTVGYGTGIDPNAPPPEPEEPKGPDATLAVGDSYTWEGEPTTNASFALGCDAPEGEGCDETLIDVSEAGTLTVDIADAAMLSDFDLSVVAPDGTVLSDGSPGSTESVVIPDAGAGVYTVRVEAFATVGSVYRGTATLT